MPTLPACGRHDLGDREWTVLEPLLPAGKKPGRPRKWSPRQLIDGIRWRTRTGSPWRDVPELYGPWQPVYGLFRRWRVGGTWAVIVLALQALADDAGHVTWSVSVDSAPRGRTSTPPGQGRTLPRRRSRPAPSRATTGWAGPAAG